MKDKNITIAGATRDQATTIGNILIDAALSQGCAVFAWQEDAPERFGRKNYHHIRISDIPPAGPFSLADVFVDLESTGQWAVTTRDDIDSSDMKRFPAKDRIENHQITGGIFTNAELLGAVSAVIGIDFYTLIHQLAGNFAHIGDQSLSGIQAAAERGYAFAAGKARDFPKRCLPVRKQRYVGLTGNDAIAMGAAYAGCRFIYSCPVKSSNRLITFFEKKESRFGKFARRMECAVTPIYSADNGGIKKKEVKTVRQRTGLKWKAEEIFLNCLADTPAVIVLGQRPQKDRGTRPLPRKEDYPPKILTGKNKTSRAVLIPENAEDAFYKTILSFQLTDAHQKPVFILADPMVAESLFSVGEIDAGRQTLFAYLSDPEKIKYRMENINIMLGP
jgi:2-oxoglutarate/2-oxoacid ferredoxin oxidoreductase subunit alpha